MANKREIEIAVELDKYLNEKELDGIIYDIDVRRNTIVIEIEGDWKHAHLRCDYLVGEFCKSKGNEVVHKAVTEIGHSECDWYHARRGYLLEDCFE